jgi:heavy metal sensor kinase
MFSKRIRFGQSLSARLTALYGVILTLSVAAAFLTAYLFMRTVLREGIDQDLISQGEVMILTLHNDSLSAVRRHMVLEAQAAGERKVFFRLLTPDGVAFSSSNMAFWREIRVDPEAVRRVMNQGGRVFRTVRLPGRDSGVRVMYARLGSGVILQTGQTLLPGARLISAFLRIAFITLVVLGLLSGVIGWMMARKALSGIGTVTKTALRIAEGNLDLRVPTRRGAEEINRLAEAFNRMVGRIAALVAGIREMSDNIAHDLKSPITRIRGAAEVALTSSDTVEEYQETAAGTVEECDRLLGMINTLLLISRTEAGVSSAVREPVDLAEQVRDACDLFRPLAEDRSVALDRRTPDRCVIQGDTRQIQRAVANLIDNAIRYTPEGGAVLAAVTAAALNTVEVAVEDTGAGIAPEDLPHIFDRFYRADPSRSDTGAGLGLSLVRAVAQAHGGGIDVVSEPGEGAAFYLSFRR